MATVAVAPPQTVARRRVEREALRDIAPVLVGLVPFAMVLGVTMSNAAIDPVSGVVGSLLLWAGSAQLAAVALLDTGADLLSILGAVVLINARFVMYGAVLEPRFRDQPAWFRWLGPQFLVDQNYVLATSRSDLTDPAVFRRYWLTTVIAIGAVWLSVIGATMTFGALLPARSPLEFAAASVVVGLLVPKLRNRPARQAAAAAAAATVAATALPGGMSLLVGVIVGVAAPAVLSRRTS